MQGALAGLRVIEVAAIGPVPFAAMMLADMGAEVIRIDRIPPQMDDGRGPPNVENRGRQSVAVNLKSEEAIGAVLRLLEGADVLLEGFRPGVMEKLGLGPEVCLTREPRLIYGRMTGWGQTGPLARAAGHDINYLALSGALHAMGWSDRPPTPPLNLVGDYGGGGMMLVVGILAALHARQRTGHGQVIDAAMADGAAMLMAPIYNLLAQGMWRDTRQANFLDGGAHYYGVYECADGRYVAIGSIEPQFYALLLEKCGIVDPDFGQVADPEAWPRLRKKLADVFRTRSRDQWCEVMEGTDVCFAPVLSMREAPEHSHNRARGTFVEMGGSMQPAPAPRFSATPSSVSTAIPDAGEHSRDLLESVGFTPAEVDRLIREGAVYAGMRQLEA